MKRFGAFLASGLVASLFIGCDGGLKEGAPPPAEQGTGQPSGFQAEMERNSGKMGTLKAGKTKANPGAPAGK